MKILAAELPTKQAAELAAKITGESKKALYDFSVGVETDFRRRLRLFLSTCGVNDATISYRQKAGYCSLSVCRFYRLYIGKVLFAALLPPPCNL